MNIRITNDKHDFKKGEIWDAAVNSKRDLAILFDKDDCTVYFYNGEFAVESESPPVSVPHEPRSDSSFSMSIRDFLGGEFAKLKIDVEFK